MKRIRKPDSAGFKAWFIWAVASLFYFYEYFLRVAPSVMVPELRTHFAISGAGLGMLAALFFYAYSPMQIVVGVMLDRWGGRKIIPAAVAICGLGALLFGVGSLYIAGLGRIFMGIGASFAFVGALYVATNWFPQRNFALLSGLTTALGMIGAAAGQAPVVAIIHASGWRAIWIYCAIAAIFLMLILWLVIPNRPPWAKDKALKKEPLLSFPNLRRVVKNPQSWIIGLFGGLINVPTSVFAVLWGVSFLNMTYDVPKEVAASAVSMIFIGWTIGGPLAGWWSDRIKRRKPPMIIGASIVLVATLIAIYVPNLPVWSLFAIMLLIGIASGGQVVCFASAYEVNPPEAKGNSLAVTNMLVTILGALLQPLVGWLLDYFAHRRGAAHTTHFLASDYHSALIAVPACVLLALIFALMVRETHGKPLAK